MSAEEGSRTFVGADGDRINWKKFEVLGEVLLPMMKSQGASYPNLAKHDNARELILGCRMPTDEEVRNQVTSVEGTTNMLNRTFINAVYRSRAALVALPSQRRRNSHGLRSSLLINCKEFGGKAHLFIMSDANTVQACFIDIW